MESVPVVVATPVEAELVDRLRGVDDRLDVRFEPDLLPPPRFPSDHRGALDFERSPADEDRFSRLVEGAEVLYGIPGDTPEGIAWAVRTAPGLRFLQATAAGAGEQVRAAASRRRSSTASRSRARAEFMRCRSPNGACSACSRSRRGSPGCVATPRSGGGTTIRSTSSADERCS